MKLTFEYLLLFLIIIIFTLYEKNDDVQSTDHKSKSLDSPKSNKRYEYHNIQMKFRKHNN
jgi:hypothetical protein